MRCELASLETLRTVRGKVPLVSRPSPWGLGHLNQRGRWLTCELASLETTDKCPVVRLRPMEAVFISLMVLVVLLTGFVALMVLYKLFKTGS